MQPPDIHAEAFDANVAKRHRYLNYPPYGLGLLAKVAEEEGHDCFVDNHQDYVLNGAQTDGVSMKRVSAMAQWATKEDPNRTHVDIVCITCMFSQTHKSLQVVSGLLYDLFPEATQILGGVHVTNSLTQEETRDKFLADLPCADEFMLYECDAAFRERLRGNYYQCVVRKGPTVEWYKERLNPDELDRIPAWHLMDPRETSKRGKVGAFYFLRGDDPVVATVLSNRGCRAHCTFCSVRNFNGEGVRRRGVDSVVDELLLLQNDYGVQHIMWLDDDFLFDRRETVALFDQMVQRGVKLTWDCSNGVIAKSCTEEILSGAVASGCIGLILGMESGNADILKEIKKPGTVRVFLKAAEIMRKFETIHTRVFLMIGFPGETLRQIKDTLDVAKEMDLDWYNIAPLQALPNTPIYKAANPTDFTEIKFNSGPHSRVAQRGGVSPWLLDFKHAFDNLDRVPEVSELDGIWAYMNYHLNYDRLQRETRPIKLRMQQKYVEHICDLIAPDNAFAMHYSMMLSRKLGEKVSTHQKNRLWELLLQQPYWVEQFKNFQLLETEVV